MLESKLGRQFSIAAVFCLSIVSPEIGLADAINIEINNSRISCTDTRTADHRTIDKCLVDFELDLKIDETYRRNLSIKNHDETIYLYDLRCEAELQVFGPKIMMPFKFSESKKWSNYFNAWILSGSRQKSSIEIIIPPMGAIEPVTRAKLTYIDCSFGRSIGGEMKARLRLNF